jgi:hypothetical protein
MPGSAHGEQQDDGAAESQEDSSRRLDLMMRLMSPEETTAAEVAAAIAGGRVSGPVYPYARRRMERGAGLADIRETARLLLEGAGDPPGLEVLAWAAEAAWLGGDAGEERRCFRAMLARTAPDAAGAAGRIREWTAVLRQVGEHGRPGEAIDLLEPYLREHPDDDTAAYCHFSLLLDAGEMREPGERDRAALERFADHSCMPAFRKAIGTYLAARPDLGTFVAARAAAGFGALPGRLLPEPVLAECAALIFEASLHGADLSAAALTAMQAIRRVKTRGTLPQTALRLMAADPETPPDDARRALQWAEHGQYGLWQLRDPMPSPGVSARDLATGTSRYLSFPPGALDGAAPWSVWLGAAVPLDGTWRITGTGIMLSPDEADAVAEALSREVSRIIQSAGQEIPLAEMAGPEPVPYGSAPPHGCRWDFASPPGGTWTGITGSVLMMTATVFLADVGLQRLHHPAPAPDPVPDPAAWAQTPLPRLHGLTPRQCADTTDVNRQILIDSLFHAYEYQAALALPGEPAPDVRALRNELWPSHGDE